MSATRAGLGIAPMPCAVAAGQSGIKPVTGPIPELTGKMWVLTRKEWRLDPAVNHMMELIVEHLTSQSDVISGRDFVPRD